jgi:ribose 5-phosphate isomerase A
LTEAETQKRRAAERAVEYVESGMRLGLGTGSTARHVLDVISERLREGSLRDIVGVATSRVTAEYAAAVNIPLRSLDEEPHLDLTIDGADEVDPRLDLIKGLGGALLWEKIVACASDRVVIVADASKRVRQLGEKAPLPVEVIPFGWRTHLPFLRDLGCAPSVRQIPSGAPFMTDGGHVILDCKFDGGIPDPRALEASLNGRPGIVDSGLFLGIATMAVIAGPAGAVTLTREDAT